MTLAAFCERVAHGGHLTTDEMSSAVDWLMSGQAADDEIAAFLLALREKGETVEEIAGAAKSLRRHMLPIVCRREVLIDTCGTGGDASDSFNISTAAAIVVAAAGIPVAKHGNRSVTSRSGSSEVLQVLGVRVDAPVPIVEKCLNELGIGFCFAPYLHPAMKHVAAARKRLGVRTVFNLIGPLCNPASAAIQLIGVGHSDLRLKLAEAIQTLGTRRALVVSGADGMDEVSSTGVTLVTEVTPRGLRQITWQPADFGLECGSSEAFKVNGPEHSAAMVRDILAGRQGPPRDIVVLNAAAALWAANTSVSLPHCTAQAAAAIDSGAASDLLARWCVLSNS